MKNKQFSARYLRQTLTAAAFVLSTATGLWGQTASVQQIRASGPTDQRINLVFLSEGYVAAELQQFIADANTLLNYILSVSPYNAYASSFNAFAISVASAESGSDHPEQGTFADTYFSSTYGTGSLQRLIRINFEGNQKVASLLVDLMPEFDIVVMIVNDPVYGGAGGFPAITSVHASAPEIVVHEIGHSFAGLTDEYESPLPGQSPTEQLNATAQIQREAIRWNVWIKAATPLPTPATSLYSREVGLFEGAQYLSEDWFRPKLNCKMRELGVPFCEVCAEAHVHAIYQVLRPARPVMPDTIALTMSTDDSLEIELETLAPSVRVQWRLNDMAIDSAASSQFLLNGAGLAPGTYQLKALVSDTTALARIQDVQAALQDSLVWTIEVEQGTTPVQQVAGAPETFALYQNFPNPFNPQTEIAFALPQSSRVELDIYNLRGQYVRRLIDAWHPAGRYAAQWDGRDHSGRTVATGLYLYRLKTAHEVAVKKMILSR